MVQEQNLPHDESVGNIETVAQFNGAMPTGVTVSHEGRIFVCYPKWGDEVPFTVAEIKDGEATAYPSQGINRDNPGDLFDTLISVQSVVVDPHDRLWILDTGSPEFKPTTFGGPKLVGVNLQNNTIFKKIFFPRDVVLPTTYLNDVRFDLRRGQGGMAFITDSADKGPNGIIVVDLASGESWRKLNDHPSTKAESQSSVQPMVEGQPFLERPAEGSPKPVQMGADGIALSADGSRLYYCPLISRLLYSVPTDLLADRTSSESDVANAVVNEGNKGGGADGLECDSENRVYATSYEHNSIVRRNTDGQYETIAHDPRMLWPDTMSLATDGYLYFTCNQLHRQARYQGGKDQRHKPYSLFRVQVDAKPVLLQ
jgi:sugar lactone lactonase YvrE